jgi:hypothetical protein
VGATAIRGLFLAAIVERDTLLAFTAIGCRGAAFVILIAIESSRRALAFGRMLAIHG